MTLTIHPYGVFTGLAAALAASVPATLTTLGTAEGLTLRPFQGFEARDDIETPAPKNRPHLAVRREQGRFSSLAPMDDEIDYHWLATEIVITVDASGGDRSSAGSRADIYLRAVEYELITAARTLDGVLTVRDVATAILKARPIGQGKRYLRQAVLRCTIVMRTTHDVS